MALLQRQKYLIVRDRFPQLGVEKKMGNIAIDS